MTTEQIQKAALELPPAERESLAEKLLLSISDHDRDAIDAAWLTEVRRRDAAFAAGTQTLRPVDEVVNRLQNRTSR